MSEEEAEYDKFRYDATCMNMEMLQKMHPAIVLMIAWTNLWCKSNSITPVWTSWQRSHERNIELGASDVHVYRAADLSLKRSHGWNTSLEKRFIIEFRRMFLRLGAWTKQNDLVDRKKPRLLRKPALIHDSGHGRHLHLQCSPDADIDFILKTAEVDDLDKMKAAASNSREEKKLATIDRAMLQKEIKVLRRLTEQAAQAKDNYDNKSIDLAKYKENFNIKKGYIDEQNKDT